LVEILIHGQNRGILEQLINFFHLLLCLSLVCFEVVKRITAYSSKIQHRRNLPTARLMRSSRRPWMARRF
ncbi:MAG TPA: hypothetical protein DCG57_13480, partial [Candidatus Riflebacteria bacterium]|nr:hypothetical protein [Candidatus Riflebacteria bacterium]